MGKGYLVTGGTGFVGGALVIELLRATEAPVACLVRARRDSASDRLDAALAKAAAAYGLPEGFWAANRHRVHAVEGDLSSGLRDVVPPPFEIGEVWHSAASLQFEDKHKDAIFETNVEGTRAVLALAGRLGVDMFNHISTAYVAGTRAGTITEEPVSPETATTNNLYEMSKIHGENLVLAAEGFATRIFRPSIVVGHSRTMAATSFSGMYGFVKELQRFKRIVEKRLGTFLSMRSMNIIAEPSVPINLVPVDLLAQRAVELSLAGTRAKVVHLSNATPPTVGEAIETAFRLCGFRRPTYVPSEKHFTSMDEQFDKGIVFYRSYINGHKVFEQGAPEAVSPIEFHFDADTLTAFMSWYLVEVLGVAVPRAEEPAGLAVAGS